MHGQLNYIRANDHIADLQRAAQRERFAGLANHESFPVRALSRLRGRERTFGDRTQAQLSGAEATRRPTDAAAAEA